MIEVALVFAIIIGIQQGLNKLKGPPSILSSKNLIDFLFVDYK
jgi:hypothetical protein